MTRLVELVAAASGDAWRQVGLDLRPADDGPGEVAVVAGVRLRVVEPGADGVGLRRWVLAGDQPGDFDIDGVATTVVAPGPTATDGTHRLGAIGVDHVVVMTPSLDRTCAAIEAATGEPLKRVRDAGGGVRQGFHRFGSVIVEVVERPDLAPGSRASLWGLVFTVADLHEVAAWSGPDVLSPPKAAVQPGRFIATFRPEAGLGLPVALMTPDPRHG